MKGAKDLRIVFMGTPEFAVESLKALIENGYHVVAVVTAPDRPSGRGLKMHESDVKRYASSIDLPVLQPEKLKDETFLNELSAFNPDIQIVVAFRMLPEIVWAMPSLGTFNLHGSLLPNYRGAAPLNWAIINGDEQSGVTTFMLQHEIDTGNILFHESIPIDPDMNVGQLHDQLMKVGAGLVIKTLEAIAEGNLKPLPQSQMTIDPVRVHAPKIFKEDCKIQWDKPVKVIYNLIRGLSPYPTAWTNLQDETSVTGLKIFHTSFEILNHTYSPGTILSDNKKFMKIACSDGYLNILDLQLAGKKRMEITDFLRGFSNITQYKTE